MHLLAEKIAFFLLEKEIIKQEKTEICSFGLEILLATVANGLLVLIASLILGVFLQTVSLLIPFIFIRRNAGGYHAKTHLGCMTGFLTVYIISIFAIKAIPLNVIPYISAILLTISSIIIFFIGAVKHHNRPVTILEFKRFKTKSRVLLIVLFITGMEGIFLFPHLFSFYTLGLFIAACSLLAAWINKTEGAKTHE